MYRYFFTVLLFGILGTIKAQEIQAISVGARMPDYEFDALNYSKSRLNIRDFSGKLLLLDLWNTRCASCIAQFPKLTELLKEFEDKIAIVAVGIHDDKYSDIYRFYNDKLGGDTGSFSLPIAISPRDDSVFRKMVPYTGFPHVLWISPDQEIIGITGAAAITAENIQSCLDNNPPDFMVKRPRKYVSIDDEFLIPIDGYQNSLGIPVSSGYVDTLIGTSGDLHAIDGYKRMFFVNASIHTMYRFLYQNLYRLDWLSGFGGLRRIVTDGAFPYWGGLEQYGFNYWQNVSYRKHHLYCWELILPDTLSEKAAYARAIELLDQYFHVRSKIEMEVYNVLLILPENSDLNQKKNVHMLDSGRYQNLSSLVDWLNSPLRNLPTRYLVLNETISNSAIINHRNTSNEVFGIVGVMAYVRKLGLSFKEKRLEVPVLSLTYLGDR